MGQRMARRNQTGMDALEQSVRTCGGQPDQPDAKTEGSGLRNVSRQHVADARDADRVEVQSRAE